jgi:hypothetical protein
MAATHDTASASHRYFHIPPSTSAAWATASLTALEAVEVECGVAGVIRYSAEVGRKERDQKKL